jgi:hypothetical protein
MNAPPYLEDQNLTRPYTALMHLRGQLRPASKGAIGNGPTAASKGLLLSCLIAKVSLLIVCARAELMPF